MFLPVPVAGKTFSFHRLSGRRPVVNFSLSVPALVVLVCTAIAAVTDWHNFTIRNVITLPLIVW